MFGTINCNSSIPTSIVSGKPIWNTPICGAARLRMPSDRLAISSAATTGNASSSPIEKIVPPQFTSERQPAAPSRSAEIGSVWKVAISALTICR